MKAAQKLFMLFGSLLLLNFAIAQPPQIMFNKVLPPEGKPFKHVTGMVQDKRGFLWLATKNGLFRYDGYEMVVYKHNPHDPSSLASDALETVTTDANGVLWIGTAGAGLERFNPVTGVFTHFRHDSKDQETVSENWISAVLVDHQGTLWVGTGKGLDRLNASTGKFMHFRHDPKNPGSISSNEVVSLYEDRQQTLWVGTGNVYVKGHPEAGGLNRFERATGMFTRYLHDPNHSNSLTNNKVRALYEDSKGNFWVGTAGDGLHRMDRSKGTFHHHPYNPARPESLSRPPISKDFAENDHITFIQEDAAGALWIGTAESGMNYFNPEKGKIIHFISGKDTAGSFTDRTTWRATTSREGVLWISSLHGGLYRVSPFQRNIPFYPSPSGQVEGFYEEEDGAFWIGTQGGGLLHYDKGNNLVKRYNHDPNDFSSLGSNHVGLIYRDVQRNTWIGTHEAGLYLFDKRKETFTPYRHHPKQESSLSNDIVMSMFEDRATNLWVGTMRGLNKMNKKDGTFKRYIFYPDDTTSFGVNSIRTILESRQGHLWVGSWNLGGLHRLNPSNGKFSTYLKGKTIINIFEDNKGTLWVSEPDGLFRFNSAADSFYRVPDPVSGRYVNNLRSALIDDKGNFWFGTSDGIMKTDVHQNVTTLYGKNFGVAGNDLAFGFSYKGPTGKLYFGSSNGYYAFYPEQVTKGIKPPEILLSAFYLGNKMAQPGKDGPLKAPIWEAKKIELPYNQNVFSFEFAAIDFVNPADNRHLFMLDDYDNEWRQGGAEHKAYYFNVPPGHYTFRVKAANSDGLWAEKSLVVVITPPWWRTWWAYFLYGLLFVVGAYLIYRHQKRRLVAAERERARTRELAQAKEIERAYQELKVTQAQLVQREKMASLGELTAGIAHEIQNPLNFVNNFSETNKELVAELQQEIKNKNYEEAAAIAADINANEEKISHHGKRADNIVKGMLQHARASSGEKQPTDINQLTEEYLRLAYQGLRAKDKTFTVHLQTSFDETIGQVTAVPQEIGRVLLNLYNNAFYAVQEKKAKLNGTFEPIVSVSTKKEGNSVVIVVKDNGTGMSEQVVNKVFQPFFTTKPTGEGTGLGLSLSYDIVTKGHNGTINVESKEGEGSLFVITLPTT